MYVYIYIYIYIAIRQLRVCHHRCAMASWKAGLFGTCKNMSLAIKSSQAKHAETDPRHGTPTTARSQPPEASDSAVWPANSNKNNYLI